MRWNLRKVIESFLGQDIAVVAAPQGIDARGLRGQVSFLSQQTSQSLNSH
jgi:hypothetical protein